MYLHKSWTSLSNIEKLTNIAFNDFGQVINPEW